MKRYHGTPQQFEDMIREALGELNPADACTDITASYEGWERLASKSVPDADGFYTDYTLYVNENTGLYVCVFGDTDYYGPEEGYFDFETESEDEAWEWFDSYTGFDDDDDIYSSSIESTTYIDEQGILGEPGASYNYDELWEIYDELHEEDPAMNEYDSFDYWFKDTKKYFKIVSATNTAGIAAAPKSLNDIDDITTVEIHGSDEDVEEIDECELSWI